MEKFQAVRDEHSNQGRKIRWAVLGTSFISGIMVEAIRASQNGVVHCVAGRTTKNVQVFAAQHNISISYTDYDAMLSDAEVDAVYIGLPTKLHAKYTMKCISAGKHILCEKAFTLNAREAAEVIAHVREKNVFLMEAQMYRCHPIILRLKQVVVTEKPFGNVKHIKANFSAPIIDLFNREAGGSIMDLGCYPVSLCRYLLGDEIVNMTGTGVIVPPRHANESAFDSFSEAKISFASGAIATIQTSNDVDPLIWQFSVACETGTIELSNLWDDALKDQCITLTPLSDEAEGGAANLETKIVVNSDKNFYTLQMDTVHTHIANGDVEASSPAMNWEDSINNMILLDKWREAVGLRYPADSDDTVTV